MRYLNKIVFINSAHVRYAEINLNGNVHLIGTQGVGKSPLLRALLLFYNADKQKLGIVLADSCISGYLTVSDTVPVLASLYPAFDKAFFLECVERFRLPMDKKIKEFSTGMKAKLKVIIAISHQAKLLILDEPTAGLDVVARDGLLDLLRDYMGKDEERSILISSHISSDLASLCDDLYMIDSGKIILHEDTDTLIGSYALLKLTAEQYVSLDKTYILKTKKENYGYSCLTNEKQFYAENYPQTAIENSGIDEVISMMVLGQ